MGYIMELRELVGKRPLIMTSAGVLVLDEKDRLLLAHRTDNEMWGLPGGSMEPGETLEETAKRELFEEAGLVGNNMKLLDLFSGEDLYYMYPNGDEVYIVAAIYICRDYSGTLKADGEEMRELQFFDCENLPPHINPADRPVINRLRTYLKEQK